MLDCSYGLIAQLGAHAVLKQSGVIYHAPPSGFWGLKYGLVAQLGERSVRIRKVEGSTPLRVHKTPYRVKRYGVSFG